MKERPIIFGAPMIRALLDGSKTQTRRIVKPQPPADIEEFLPADPSGFWGFIGNDPIECIHCQRGDSGDKLWIRETWRAGDVWDESLPSKIPARSEIKYEADGSFRSGTPLNEMGRLRSPIFMPRWASRITLAITRVRVERLHDISEEDARAEGCNGDCPVGYIPAHKSSPCVSHFAQLWESINGAGSWVANPWVFVLTFRRAI